MGRPDITAKGATKAGDLVAVEVKLLRELYRLSSDGKHSVSLKQLSYRLDIQKPNLSRILKALSKRGYVRYGDGTVELTDKGFAEGQASMYRMLALARIFHYEIGLGQIDAIGEADIAADFISTESARKIIEYFKANGASPE